ncbi:hypothetical protein FY528_10560 [Hymenobacter lutimineralis]|uniref:Anti-sigma factor n=1 Tax=Hymenobacter lutimineralis TaxID=2606448 RepID=A0A5D6V0P6_9BACT|nr:hypothetical protein [Hymenobacter lutimineralis]TYZ09671.1 hypothetical protein FY528_10560 [Hymenobacter lutimineralis]
MQKKPTGLEDFVDRHRGEFDAFEPSSDLWASIEQKLAGPAVTEDEEPVLRLLPELEVPQLAVAPGRQLPVARYGMAAAVALLLLLGLGYLWPAATPSAPAWKKATLAPWAVQTETTTPNDALSFYTGGQPTAIATAAVDSPRLEIARAVQRMEAYYAAQILERQAELHQLEQEASVANSPADWSRELASLDSTYHELKGELARNPDPNMVLDAMNRNLQIRLDILNQQLRTRERINDSQETPTLYADNR